MSIFVLGSEADGAVLARRRKHGSWLWVEWRIEQQRRLGEDAQGRAGPRYPEVTSFPLSRGNLRTLVAAAVSLGSRNVFGWTRAKSRLVRRGESSMRGKHVRGVVKLTHRGTGVTPSSVTWERRVVWACSLIKGWWCHGCVLRTLRCAGASPPMRDRCWLLPAEVWKSQSILGNGVCSTLMAGPLQF